jgi:hypothetical protein
MNGAAVDFISRTADYIAYRSGQPALALIDVDTKGMPAGVRDKIEAAGGMMAAIAAVMPELDMCGRVVRRSTSTGIYRDDTDEHFPGSEGLHIYLLVTDGSDTERFLKVLHARMWLSGYGWMVVGKAGQLLERSLIDRMVDGAERLVFEGRPRIIGKRRHWRSRLIRQRSNPAAIVDPRKPHPLARLNDATTIELIPATWGYPNALCEMSYSGGRLLSPKRRLSRNSSPINVTARSVEEPTVPSPRPPSMCDFDNMSPSVAPSD